MTRVLVVAAVVVLSLGARGPSVRRRRQLSKKDSGRHLKLRIGDRREVVLSGNPTTGYQWEMASGDTSVVKPLGKPEYKSDSAAIGSGGQFTFAFEAAAPGQTVLRLVYHRPFEKNVRPAQTFEITVVVKS